MSSNPRWKAPLGVDPAVWEYATSPRLASEESDFLAEDPLTIADESILVDRFRTPCDLIDLGSGAGRLSMAFARRGFRVSAVDLSVPMLQMLRRSASREGVHVACIRANLCRLEGIVEHSHDVALMMYSTIGMISGRAARRDALASCRRILRPQGELAIHVHNFWIHLRNPQGRRWLLGEVVRRGTGREPSDRRMTYRGIPGMVVHPYRWPELREDLSSAGFQILGSIPLDSETARPIRWPKCLPGIRAGGWIVFARTRD